MPWRFVEVDTPNRIHIVCNTLQLSLFFYNSKTTFCCSFTRINNIEYILLQISYPDVDERDLQDVNARL